MSYTPPTEPFQDNESPVGGGLGAELDAAFLNSTVAALTDIDARVSQLAINAKDFGAVGDGTTDDRAAIQAAIDTAAAADGGTVFLPAGNYSVGTPVLVKDKVRLVGVARSATTIRASASFTGSHVVRIGAGTGIVFAAAVQHMQIRASDVVDNCVYTTEGQELSGVFDCALTHFRNSAIRCETGMRYMAFERLELYGSALGWSYGVDLNGCTGPIYVRSVTVNSNSTDVAGLAGIRATNTKLHAVQIHGEKVANTIEFSTGGIGIAENIDATTLVSERAIKIASGNPGGIVLLNVASVNDEVTGTNTSRYQTAYFLDAWGSSKGRWTQDPAIPSVITNQYAYRAATTKLRNHITNATGTVNVDLTASDYQQVTLIGNVILTASNFTDGQEINLTIVQGGTGGYTVTWPSGVRWAGGVAPTLSTTVNTHDVFKFLIIGSRMREVSRSLGTAA